MPDRFAPHGCQRRPSRRNAKLHCIPMAAVGFCAVLFAGCGHVPLAASAAETAALSAMVYPTDLPEADCRVIAVPDGHHLRLINTGADTFRDCHVWLDQQWVGTVPLLPVGQEVRLDLAQCVNVHGEPFPVGVMLRPDLHRPLVLVEIVPLDDHRRLRALTRPRNTR